ncbi:DNA-binding response regulator, NarL/FixJ family, contains REC and HTH domains [Lentzea fradiae]|uniref:DNA-binding response regulator, NarL/FixJ family, contains REC and HTH domains n=1 Tax=Lentzea fradiae TaxID=200378 RepID=A0A1G7TM83_9PSEU|nr:response regulator transcription factor [Lentzea fradiae]SDG36438.1 DNA-binding response regulator, NarL/FixJ family, contains REC and HTH domains [Lentzea fradiae]
MTDPASTRVLLVDGSQLITEGLRVSLHRTHCFRVVGIAHTVADAARFLRSTPVELVVTDFDVPGAGPLRTVRDTAQFRPGARVVVLSNADSPSWARAALDAGAVAYLLKTSPVAELLPTIAAAVKGAPATIDARVGSLARLPARMPPPASLGRLSAREFDVLAEMAKGMDNARIAQRLFISNDTVKTHVKAILRKLGARDRAHAVAMVLSESSDSFVTT